MTKALLALTGLIFTLSLAVPAMAGTYKWIDEEGNVVYSQHPPPEGQFEAIKVKPTPRSNKGAGNKSFDSNKWLDKSTADRKDKNKVKSALEKNKKLRKDNCDKAHKQLEQYTVYRRFKNDKGVFERIPDDKRDAGIKEAKAAIKEFCD